MTPIPTRTPAPCSFVMEVSDEIGGPGRLLDVRTEQCMKEGHEHSAAIPGSGPWPGRSKDNADIRLR